jgi:hypothetical protein
MLSSLADHDTKLNAIGSCNIIANFPMNETSSTKMFVDVLLSLRIPSLTLITTDIADGEAINMHNSK